MRLPIQYALTYPERLPGAAERLDLAHLGSLTFADVDADKFPCLDLAYTAGRTRRHATRRCSTPPTRSPSPAS